MIFFTDIPITIVALLALAGLAAGLSRGFSGFGAALIFVPAASALAGPKMAAAILVVIDPIFTSFMIPAALKVAEKKSVVLVFIGALIGVPIGTAVLMHYPPLTLRWLIAIMASAMLALLVSGWRYRGKPHEFVTIVVGAISGLFTGIAQIGGPAVVCYWMGTDTEPAKLRANIILLFAASSVLTIVTYFWGGLMSFEVVKLSLIAGPAYGLGILIGNQLFPLASPTFFRSSSLALIAIAVLMSLPIFG
jgi:uncharacterized protein